MNNQNKQPLDEQIEQLKKEVAAVADTVSQAASGQLEHVQDKAGEARGQTRTPYEKRSDRVSCDRGWRRFAYRRSDQPLT